MPRFLMKNDEQEFPDARLADRDGLIAVGGDLSAGRLIRAYTKGLFPWFGPEEPILWWSPDPRCVLLPGRVHVQKSMRKTVREYTGSVTADTDFENVINKCASIKREGQSGTWITQEMLEAYTRLHKKGIAHSIEVWEAGKLAGGLYGVSLGSAFFGESMFSEVADASKLALIALCRFCRAKGIRLIDCQVTNPHLLRMGAEEMPRDNFLQRLAEAMREPTACNNWTHEWKSVIEEHR